MYRFARAVQWTVRPAVETVFAAAQIKTSTVKGDELWKFGAAVLALPHGAYRT